MVVVFQGSKFSCAACQNGHRSQSCDHLHRVLLEIKQKGRPATQCGHCRTKRSTGTGHSHHRCMCGDAPAYTRPKVEVKLSSGTTFVMTPPEAPEAFRTRLMEIKNLPISVHRKPKAKNEQGYDPQADGPAPVGAAGGEAAAAGYLIIEWRAEFVSLDVSDQFNSEVDSAAENPCKCHQGGPCICATISKQKPKSARASSNSKLTPPARTQPPIMNINSPAPQYFAPPYPNMQMPGQGLPYLPTVPQSYVQPPYNQYPQQQQLPPHPQQTPPLPYMQPPHPSLYSQYPAAPTPFSQQQDPLQLYSNPIYNNPIYPPQPFYDQRPPPLPPLQQLQPPSSQHPVTEQTNAVANMLMDLLSRHPQPTMPFDGIPTSTGQSGDVNSTTDYNQVMSPVVLSQTTATTAAPMIKSNISTQSTDNMLEGLQCCKGGCKCDENTCFCAITGDAACCHTSSNTTTAEKQQQRGPSNTPKSLCCGGGASSDSEESTYTTPEPTPIATSQSCCGGNNNNSGGCCGSNCACSSHKPASADAKELTSACDCGCAKSSTECSDCFADNCEVHVLGSSADTQTLVKETTSVGQDVSSSS
ncbi:hypothetical protein SmJEL517_g01469 [Synchytrium microbalum]|uniref:Copper-fist domain-containing protein n=1 Tax=Synchytrium microbalum TaxID=1806994 RepID=A0A507CAQ4_9FUNG|nr:uncharacterized protein SmJEL517_g01469 [Synchytrium microbalum]TPX36259.1 hypothetical protein SmJEL517_g01469 [Synchytrium microbalum]